MKRIQCCGFAHITQLLPICNAEQETMLPFIMQKCGQISNRMHSCSICRDLLTIRAAAATLCVSTIPPIGSSCCSSFAVVRRLSSSAYVQHMLDELMLIVHITYIISIIYTVCLCPTHLTLPVTSKCHVVAVS